MVSSGKANDRLRALRRAEADGRIADSRAVRVSLMLQVVRGQITMIEARAQLRRIQADAEINGLQTRAQFDSEG